MISEAFTPLDLPSANGGVRAFHWARATFYFLVAFVFFGIVIWIWPYNPVDYKYIQFVTPTVQAGHVLIYKLYMDKHTNLTPLISRKLVSIDHQEDDIAIQAMTMGTAYLGQPFKRVFIGIPAWVSPGRYYIRAKVTYYYWGGNVIVEAPYRTPCFEVVANKGDVKARNLYAEQINANKIEAEEIKARGKIEAAEIKARKRIQKELIKPGKMKTKEQLRKEVYGR